MFQLLSTVRRRTSVDHDRAIVHPLSIIKFSWQLSKIIYEYTRYQRTQNWYVWPFFFFVHFNILKYWKKPTCDRNKCAYQIPGYLLLCMWMCSFCHPGLQHFGQSDTSLGFQFHQLRLSKHTMQVGLLQLSIPQ